MMQRQRWQIIIDNNDETEETEPETKDVSLHAKMTNANTTHRSSGKILVLREAVAKATSDIYLSISD